MRELDFKDSFTKRFSGLFVTQFLGAFNDNLFKSALLIFAAYNFPAQSALYSNIIASLFILPFFLFSATAGKTAVKYNRRTAALCLKGTELVLMFGVMLVYQIQNLAMLAGLLFLMGTQSTFYGPIKYAVLPQLLKNEELIKGNAYTEGGTYLSIILGSFLGAVLPFPMACAVLIVCALAGIVSAYFIPSVPAPQPDTKIRWNIWQETKDTLAFLQKNKVLRLSIWGITWFWTVGAFCLTEIFPLAAVVFHTTSATVSFFLLIFSLGVGIGAFLSYKILKNQISLFYVPLASIGITVASFLIFCFSLGVKTPLLPISLGDFLLSLRGIGLLIAFLMISIAGGIYVVPLNTLLQKASTPAKLPQVIAANNIVNSFGMVLITVIAAILVACKISVPCLFLLLSIFNLWVAKYIAQMYPKELVKSLFRLLMRALYRVECVGFENMVKAPKKTLLIANHTSLLDGILIAAFMPRNVCFAINTEWTKHPFIRWFSRVIDFYPIDTQNPLSIRNLINELNHGRTIMMFPEGRISVTGNLMKVFDGAGMIAEAAHAKILPLRIAGADRSKFSYVNGLLNSCWFPKIRMQMLPPQTLDLAHAEGETKRQKIASALYFIMRDMMIETENPATNLYEELVQAYHRYGNKPIIEDGSRKILSYHDLLTEIGKTEKTLATEVRFVMVGSEPNLVNVIKLFAVWKARKVAVIGENIPAEVQQNTVLCLPDGEEYDVQTLHRTGICAYYNHGINLRDGFYNELSLQTVAGLCYGLFLPLFSGSKVFMNTLHKGSCDLVYDTDSTILCIDEMSSLERMGKTAGRLDFYAVRKVWYFGAEEIADTERQNWLNRFGLRLKKM